MTLEPLYSSGLDMHSCDLIHSAGFSARVQDDQETSTVTSFSSWPNDFMDMCM